MEKEPILPRPVALSEPLLRKWLGDKGVEKFRGAHHVQTGRRLMLEAIEDAIRERFPDGVYPPTERLLDTGPGNGRVCQWLKHGLVAWDMTGQGKPKSVSFGLGEAPEATDDRT